MGKNNKTYLPVDSILYPKVKAINIEGDHKKQRR